MKTIEILEKAWFRLEYEIKDSWIDFKAYKINKINTVAGTGDADTEDYDNEPSFEGYIKWDGCIEFNTVNQRHFCGIHHAKQDFILFKRLYVLVEKHFD